MSFDQLGLNAELLRSIEKQGYSNPTAIQSEAIPRILQGRDLMATAQTGTGKTAAFTLPLLHRLGEKPGQKSGAVRALVLAPTRELAAQVEESVRTYGRNQRLRAMAVFGGTGLGPQIRKLKQGTDVLVATPGRLMDHMERGTVDLSQVECLILDEADRMLDMGFMPAIEKIVKILPPTRQTLLFSATFSGPIKKLAHRFLNNPEIVETARDNAVTDQVSQQVYYVDGPRKRELLTHLIGTENWNQVLVFTRTKRGADELAKQLAADGIGSESIHGDKNQGARNRALRSFKQKRTRALVATDVAARGLDIDRLDWVVNYDMPDNPEDYVHRIGRTGRGGETGSAISFVSGQERGQFAGVRRLVQTDIPAGTVVGFEPKHKPGSRPKVQHKRKPGQGKPNWRAGAPKRPGRGRPARHSA